MRYCAKCHKPENDHPYRHPFVAMIPTKCEFEWNDGVENIGCYLAPTTAWNGKPCCGDHYEALSKADERIVCAALRYGDFIVMAPRHGGPDVHRILEKFGIKHDDCEQGFVTNHHNKFVSRTEAWKIAKEAGQIRHRCGGDGTELYSENLY